jgi:lactoylglutathione lyase
METELTDNHDGRHYELGNAFGHLAFFVDSVDHPFAAWKG